MPDEISCTVCGRKFTLQNVEPGQVVRCPYCQMKVEVPAPPPTPAEGAAAATGGWYVYTFEGERYGPVSKAELEEWARENRLTAECQVFQEGWPQWRWAREVFPVLKSPAGMSLHKPVSTAPPPPIPRAGEKAPASSPEPHPYAAPQAMPGPPGMAMAGQWAVPHRGGLILTLGILGLVVCAFCGPPAWIMGKNDLNAMRQGTMDPSGEGLTMAGMIMGIISTILLGLQVVILMMICAGGLASM